MSDFISVKWNQLAFLGRLDDEKTNYRHKLVTIKLFSHQVFSMPEAAIGFHTDVGASFFLSHLPGYFGKLMKETLLHAVHKICAP